MGGGGILAFPHVRLPVEEGDLMDYYRKMGLAVWYSYPHNLECPNLIIVCFLFHFRRTITSHNSPLKTSNELTKSVQLEVFNTVGNAVFSDLREHFQEQDISNEDDHGHQLIDMISQIFLRTLLYHHGRLYTERFVMENKSSKRHQLTKTILFLGQ